MLGLRRLAAATLGNAINTAADVARLPGAAARTASEALRPGGVRSVPGGSCLPVRGVHLTDGDRLAREASRALLAIDGVSLAEVNRTLGLVLVRHGPEVEAAELSDAVAEAERTCDARAAGYARAETPGDPRDVLRESVLAGADLLGSGVAVAGRVLRAVPLPPAAPALVAMAGATPRIRAGLEGRLGRPAAGLVLGVGGAVTNALSQQPYGLLLSSLQRIGTLDELRAHGRAWHRGLDGPVLGGAGFRAPPPPVPLRPAPLPDGPVERVTAATMPAGVAGALATFGLTRDVRRSQAILSAGVPKAAALGREAYATRLGRVVAERDVIVLDRAALRRLDRVDRVVVDTSLLHTGRPIIEAVVPLDGLVAADEAYEHAHALVDPHALDEPRTAGRWAVHPEPPPPRSGTPSAPSAPSLRLVPAAAEIAPEAPRTAGHRPSGEAGRRHGETVLTLTRDGEPVARISVVPEPDPYADALLQAARGAGTLRLADPGPRMLATVRSLQRAGHVVVLVAGSGRAALAAADVGIGVLERARRTPWSAHLLCGPSLATACLLLDAVAPARRVSGHSARLAGLGSVAGAVLAAAGPTETAARRAHLAVDGTALGAFAIGTWSGMALAHRPAPLATEHVPWHAWPARAVLARLGTSVHGLSSEEAARRRAEQGTAPDASPGFGQITLEELDNPLTPALATGAGISAVIGSIFDSVLIGGVVAVNAVMSGVQRVGADRALRRLTDLASVPVRLRRPAAATESDPAAASVEELVPGDVVVLAAGDAVPADCRLLTAEALEVDESSLTGESQPVVKSVEQTGSAAVADRSSMLWAGTSVAAGDAVAVVVATGVRTEAGRAARTAEAGDRRPGGVDERMRRLTEVTLAMSLGAGGVLFGAGLLRGRPLGAALGPAIALTVAAVPEGLPFVARAAEIATARRLSRRGALVRNPSTIEALGRINVLCFDKTGTLTLGRLRLGTISDGVRAWPLDRLPERARGILAAALRAGPDHDGARHPHPTDRSITRAARDLGVEPGEEAGQWERVDALPFEPSRGYHAVLGSLPDGFRLSVKGAPEVVLPRCTHWATPSGDVPLDDDARKQIEAEVLALARRGHRVLAVAERAASGRADLDDERIGRLRFLGLAGITDPPRPTAAAAVATLRDAGIQIMMVTGDHPATAEAIAADLGVAGGRVLTGTQLEGLDDDALAVLLPEVTVFARVSPAQKARVVRVLRAAGHVVAVTGDGANDAPAIRLADVGIALGERATPAARQTADLVVTDDRIETIADAVADSRAMWRSIRDALAVLLGGNLGEIGFTTGTGLITDSPLGVRQLLLINLLTDMLPAMALAIRKPAGTTRADLLREGPDTSLGSLLTRDIAVRAGTTAGAALTAWTLGRLTGTRRQAGTVALVALVATQLAQTMAAGGRDPIVLGSSVAALLILAFIVQTPGLSHLFGSTPLLPHGWVIAIGSSLGFAIAAAVLTRTGRV